jgi:hypothetical protein
MIWVVILRWLYIKKAFKARFLINSILNEEIKNKISTRKEVKKNNLIKLK